MRGQRRRQYAQEPYVAIRSRRCPNHGCRCSRPSASGARERLVGRASSIPGRDRSKCRPPTRNGGRHCCQPPSAPSEGSAGVRQLVRPEGLAAPRSWLTSSGVASVKWIPIRRRVPLRFRGPSWTNPLSRRLASRRKPRVAQERLALPAPLPAGPNRDRSPGSSPAGGDRTFRPVLVRPVVADEPGRLGHPSRSPIRYGPWPESLQAEKMV